MDLTEAEDIKKRWQEYTEELYKKDIYDPDNHDDVITNLEPEILEFFCLQSFPFCSPEDIPGPGIEPKSPALQVDSLLSEPPEYCTPWEFDPMVAQRVKNLPTTWETQVCYLG